MASAEIYIKIVHYRKYTDSTLESALCIQKVNSAQALVP